MCAKVLLAKSNAVITRRRSRIRLDTDASVVHAPGYRSVGVRDRKGELASRHSLSVQTLPKATVAKTAR